MVIECPVVVWLEFFMDKPKSSKLPTPRGDIDNYAKAVLDSMQLLIENDSLVTWLHAGKYYADEDNPPGVIIKLYPVED